MLAHLDYDRTVSPNFEIFLESLRYQKLKYYASELQQRLQITELNELKQAVNRAMSVCRIQQLGMEDHFKPIYRCEESQVIIDWKLSPLAYCLVMLNANPAHAEVARLQLQLVHRVMQKADPATPA